MEPFDVFLSHNGRDKSIVREIYQILKDRGLRPWLDEKDLVPGAVGVAPPPVGGVGAATPDRCLVGLPERGSLAALKADQEWRLTGPPTPRDHLARRYSMPDDTSAERPALDPGYEESDIYRETFLEWFYGPEDRATVRAYGKLQYSMASSYDGPISQENWRAARLRAVAKDLRYLKNLVREMGFVDPLDEDPLSAAEDQRWALYARRLAERLGTIEEGIDRELGAG